MRILIVSALLMIGAGLFSQGHPKIEFENKSLTFDNIKEGEILTFSYKFKNTGNADLKILLVKATCGCTTPEWPKNPIKPGQTGEIKVKFDSKDRVGYNAKGVNLETNAGKVNLVFEATVVK